ncbi:hypothetical protein MTO96_022449, partial [Rhipicephalus appendiculatus]
ELLYQVDHADATHILTTPQYATKVSAVKEKTNLKGLFVIGNSIPGFVSVSGFAEMNDDDFKEVHIDNPKETTLAVFPSSGTTDHPKIIEMSHYSLVANLYMTNVLATYQPGDVILTWHPIVYASGFMFLALAACTGATCVIVHPGLTFEQFVHCVNKYKVTTLASVPTRLHVYLADMIRTGTKLSSIRTINMSSTVLTATFARRILAAFDGVRSLRNHYAMSESCGILCTPPQGEISSGNVGFPAPMVQLKFIDMDTGEKVGPRQYGELYFRIPSVMKGYYKNPELMKEFVDDDGWCRSGDIMYYDEDGRVYFVDRLKDIIKCQDQPVSSMELESLLQSHPSVADAAVVGIPKTPNTVTSPAAFVVLRDPSLVSPELASELKEHVASNSHQ